MSTPDSTCWTVIEAAAAGSAEEREAFAQHYYPMVKAYLSARWSHSNYQQDLEDAIQEVFVECFKHGGVLEKANRSSASGFRAFLYGTTRNVALRTETRRARAKEQAPANEEELAQVESREEKLSAVFDRAWATALLREAGQKQKEFAQAKGEAALQRVELLRLRFQQGKPIREIAQLWQCDAAKLHHEYAQAREEFKRALLEVVAFHHPGTDEEINQECSQLLTMLG